MKAERALDLSEILLYLWQHIVIIGICILVGIIGCISVTLLGSRNDLPYAASALIYFDTSDEENADGSDQFAYYGNITTLSNVVVKSEQLLDKVVGNLHLEANAAELTNRISVETVGSSSLMSLTVRDQEPEVAQRICNEILAVMPEVSASMTNLGVLQAASQAEITAVATPGLTKPTVVGALLGLVLCVLGLVTLELFDHSIRDAQDIEYYLDMKALSVIPASGPKKDLNLSLEAYRSLCINLEGELSARKPFVLLVAGICESDQSEETAEKISETFAQMGRKVVLVDADLRNGNISKRLGLQNKAGVLELLQNKVPLETVLSYRETTPDCAVVSCGKLGQAPTEQLSSLETQKLFKELRELFDIVVVHTGAVILTSDAAVLSRTTDKVLLVARVGKTPIESALLAKDKMEYVKASVSGVVLTDYDYKKAWRRDGYYYAFSTTQR